MRLVFVTWWIDALESKLKPASTHNSFDLHSRCSMEQNVEMTQEVIKCELWNFSEPHCSKFNDGLMGNIFAGTYKNLPFKILPRQDKMSLHGSPKAKQ